MRRRHAETEGHLDKLASYRGREVSAGRRGERWVACAHDPHDADLVTVSITGDALHQVLERLRELVDEDVEHDADAADLRGSGGSG